MSLRSHSLRPSDENLLSLLGSRSLKYFVLFYLSTAIFSFIKQKRIGIILKTSDPICMILLIDSGQELEITNVNLCLVVASGLSSWTGHSRFRFLAQKAVTHCWLRSPPSNEVENTMYIFFKETRPLLGNFCKKRFGPPEKSNTLIFDKSETKSNKLVPNKQKENIALHCLSPFSVFVWS